MSDVRVRERDGALLFAVRVGPRASRDELAGTHDGALRVRLRAPPVDGAANEALVTFLAEALGVASRHVRIIHGATTRLKTVEVRGIDRGQLDRLTSSP